MNILNQREINWNPKLSNTVHNILNLIPVKDTTTGLNDLVQSYTSEIFQVNRYYYQLFTFIIIIIINR